MDHGMALKDLETAARMAGVTLPDRKFDETHQAKINAISTQEGRRLRPTILAPTSGRPMTTRSRCWSPTSRAGKSEQLKAWAIKALPVVRKHREAIGALNAAPPSSRAEPPEGRRSRDHLVDVPAE